jgi:acyl-CoA synthetase (AMP-forming)/AMP-acid ligase II
MRVRVVDQRGATCPEGVIGEIRVSGTSVSKRVGHYNDADEVSTGDLGFSWQGEICVVGRSKEIIIARGQNVYPADIEAAALKAHSAIRPGGVAAVAVRQDGSESILLALEIGRAFSEEEYDLLCRRANEEVARATGCVPWRTIAVPTATLPRTTSGKLQRRLIGDMFLRGELKPAIASARQAEELGA